MYILLRADPRVAHPSIGTDYASRLNRFFHKAMQTLGRCVGDSFHSNSSGSSSIFLRTNSYQCLLLCLAPPYSFLQSTQLRLIHLDPARKSIPPRPDHRPAQFVKPNPRRLITPQSQNPFQSQRTGTIFLTGHPPYRPKPERQWIMGILENRPSNHRCSVLALCTLENCHPDRPTFPAAATWTTKTFRPTHPIQIIPARFLSGKSPFKFHKISRIIFHNPHILHVGGTSVKWIPPSRIIPSTDRNSGSQVMISAWWALARAAAKQSA